jgi:hypothetical protein
MAYGFESTNDNGYIQISDSVSNYYMMYSGTAIVPSGSSTTLVNYGTQVVISHPTPFDAICLVTEDGYVVPQVVFSTSKTSVTILSEIVSTQTTFKYWLFKKYSSLSPSTSGYGLEIYDSAGAVAFSSNYPKLMRSYSTIPITSLSTTVQNFSLPSNRRFAFLLYGTLYNTIVNDTKAANTVKQLPIIRTYSGGVSVKVSKIRTGVLPDGASAVYEGGLIAIDVTNY